MGAFLRKYGAAATIDGLVLIAGNDTDYKSSPTLAAGDAKVSKDGGALANLATLPAVTPAASRLVRISLSSTEMEAARVVILLVDQTTPHEWEDQLVIIETYGHAGAAHAFDLDTAVPEAILADSANHGGSSAEITLQTVGAIAEIFNTQKKFNCVLTFGAVSDMLPKDNYFDTNLGEVTDGHYVSCALVFRDGTLQGQGREITGYTGAYKSILVNPAFTEPPANGDEFVILGVIR